MDCLAVIISALSQLDKVIDALWRNLREEFETYLSRFLAYLNCHFGKGIAGSYGYFCGVIVFLVITAACRYHGSGESYCRCSFA